MPDGLTLSWSIFSDLQPSLELSKPLHVAVALQSLHQFLKNWEVMSRKTLNADIDHRLADGWIWQVPDSCQVEALLVA